MDAKLAFRYAGPRAFVAALVLATLSQPGIAVAANAACGVTDTGIPADVFAPIDIAHIRGSLADVGVGFSGTYYAETFGNKGGLREVSEYDGLLALNLNADMNRLGLWEGLCFHTSGFQIHGNGITNENIGSLVPVSNIEARSATRLFELWFEQHLFHGVLSVRLGQLAADQEFILSNGANFLLDSTWGWPSIAANDLPSGGPAYPLATPGVRVAIAPNDRLSLLIGVYNGDPATPDCTNSDPQVCNSNGLEFTLDSPALLLAEGAYNYRQSQDLAGTIKIGGWNYFGTFAGEQSVPDSASGIWGIYGIVDQLLWQSSAIDHPKSVGLFARVAGAPSATNLVDLYAGTGLTFSGMVPRRPGDTIGLGVAYTRLSDQMQAFSSGPNAPTIRGYEAVLEICYTAQLNPGWIVRPDVQYFWQPGGGTRDGTAPVVENVTVFGMRSTLNF